MQYTIRQAAASAAVVARFDDTHAAAVGLAVHERMAVAEPSEVAEPCSLQLMIDHLILMTASYDTSPGLQTGSTNSNKLINWSMGYGVTIGD